MSDVDSIAQLCFNLGHLLFGKPESGNPEHEVLASANAMTGVQAETANLYGKPYENHFVSNYSVCLQMEISRSLLKGLAPGLEEGQKERNERSTNEPEAPVPVHVQLDVFDRGRLGVLDEKDHVRVNYRDAAGNLQRQSKIFSVPEFLTPDAVPGGPPKGDRLNSLLSNGVIAGSDSSVGWRIFSKENQILTGVRWYTSAPAQERMPVDEKLAQEYWNNPTWYPITFELSYGYQDFSNFGIIRPSPSPEAK